MGLQLDPTKPGFDINPFQGNANPLPNAPNSMQNGYGQQYTQGNDTAGVGGTDSQGQSSTIGMLGTMARGGGPNPAAAQMDQAIKQGQQLALAQAGSARGQFGLANAQHNAMQTGANLTQQGGQENAVLAQQQQWNAIQAQMQAQQQQRAQDLMAQGLSAQDAIAQAQIDAGQTANNQKATGGFINKLMDAASSTISPFTGGGGGGGSAS